MYKDILLPVDLGNVDTQHKAVATAIDYAKGHGSTLHIMTVVPDFGLSLVGTYFPEGYEHKIVEDTNTRLHEFAKENVPKGIKIQHIVGHGTIYQEILNAAVETGCDLIIMASHRPELQDYLLGPNASRVVRHANCSVLVVRD